MKISFSIPGKPARWQRPIEGQRADGSFYRYNDPDAEAAKEAIAKAAKAAFIGQRPATGPVILRVIGIFGIPSSWPDKLKQAALEGRVMHVSDPDLDQLVKLAKDALKGIAYVDDNQVCGYPNSAKRYGGPERTEFIVQSLAQREDEITPGQRRLEARIAKEGWDAVLAPRPPKANRPKTNSGKAAPRGRGAGGRSGGARVRRGFPRPGGGA